MSVSSVADSESARVGKRAPNFELDGLDGQTFRLKAFAGRPLFVNVFATWCPPCRLEMPLVERTLRRYRNRIAFLAVDAQEPSTVIRPYLRSVGVHARVGVDSGQLVASYGARSIPESVFIDRDGIVRAIVRGPIDSETLVRDLALIAR